MQPTTLNPTLDLCTRYPLCWVDRGSVECEVVRTRKSNPRPSDLESTALSSGPHLPREVLKINLCEDCNSTFIFTLTAYYKSDLNQIYEKGQNCKLHQFAFTYILFYHFV